MVGYIPKAWRTVAKKLDPAKQPQGPFVVPSLPEAIGNAPVHEDTRLTVAATLANLAGRTHFTLADIAIAAGLDVGFFNTPRGSVAFRGVMKNLLLSGRITAGQKGRSGGEVGEQIEAAADEVAELDW